jgi:hypothetical protein
VRRPFPFPKQLFPENTFPQGMRFSTDGLASLPPAMVHAIEHSAILSALADEPTDAAPLINSSRSLWQRLHCTVSFVLRRARRPSQRTVTVQKEPPAKASAQPPAPPRTPSAASMRFATVTLRVPSDDDPRRCGRALPPLLEAARVGDVLELSRLLELPGCDVDGATDGDERALLLASDGGHTAAMALLLAHGAIADAPTTDGWTALHSAAQLEEAEATALLLACGANVHARTRTANVSALHVAAFNGRLGALKAVRACHRTLGA